MARDGGLTMLSLNGEILPGWPVALRSAVQSAPAVGDLDGDGFLDLAVGLADGEIEVLHHTGLPFLGWRVRGGPVASAVFADVTGDSIPELVGSFDDHRLTAWGSDGDPVPGWPLAAGAGWSLTPLVGDLEGDGAPEVIVLGDDLWLYAFEVSWVGPTGPAVWGAHLGSSARTASYPAHLLPAVAPQRPVALDDRDVVVFPNPCREDAVRVRYELGFETTVTVTVLDLTGQEVWTGRKHSPAGVPDEIQWPVHGVASGLYLCKVEAREQKGSTIVFRKVAVVK